jgi:hypothetical protein
VGPLLKKDVCYNEAFVRATIAERRLFHHPVASEFGQVK